MCITCPVQVLQRDGEASGRGNDREHDPDGRERDVSARSDPAAGARPRDRDSKRDSGAARRRARD